MRILALETSAARASVAALQDGRLVDSRETPAGTRSAQALPVSIQRVLAAAGWSPRDVELVAVTQGPGSFTGLRIGVLTAKTFAYASGAAVKGVNTLEVIAAQTQPKHLPIWALLDAQRQQLFAASFRPTESGQLEVEMATRVLNIDEVTSHLDASILCGSGVELLGAKLPEACQLSDHQHWTPRAETVARLAEQKVQGEGPDDLWTLTPNYYRKSAAEEKLEGALGAE